MDDLELFEQQLKAIRVPEKYWSGKDYEYRYWFSALLQRLDACLDFKCLPENWPKNFFSICLWSLGHVVIFNSERFGLSFQPCTLGGVWDFYYQPSEAIVTNPKFQKRFTIGKDAELVKVCGDYKGILDLVDYYATKLSNLSTATNMGVANAKLPAVFSARNEAEKRTIEAAYDDVQSGKPIIITKYTANSDEVIPMRNLVEVWNQDFKQTYIVTDLLTDTQTILDQFYNEIGIAKTVDKASHILNQEASFQDRQSEARIRDWKKYLDESFEKVNKMFGTNMEVDYAREDYTFGDGEVPEQAESKPRR